MLCETKRTRPPGVAQLLHPPEAAALELGVADGEHLVDEQDLRLELCGDREGEANGHPARVPLDRRVDEALDAGELHDLGELPGDLATLHAEHRAVQVDVLAPGQLRMEAGADLEQAAHAPADLRPPLGRGRDPRQDLQQRRLAGAVRGR